MRVWVRALARDHGIIGSVRNRGDGSVEVEAAGSPTAIATFRDELRRGPAYARIDAVTEIPAEIASTGGFSIRP
jgi:acylphosphatase